MIHFILTPAGKGPLLESALGQHILSFVLGTMCPMDDASKINEVLSVPAAMTGYDESGVLLLSQNLCFVGGIDQDLKFDPVVYLGCIKAILYFLTPDDNVMLWTPNVGDYPLPHSEFISARIDIPVSKIFYSSMEDHPPLDS